MTKEDWIEYYMKICDCDYIKAEQLAERKMNENKIPQSKQTLDC